MSNSTPASTRPETLDALADAIADLARTPYQIATDYVLSMDDEEWPRRPGRYVGAVYGLDGDEILVEATYVGADGGVAVFLVDTMTHYPDGAYRRRTSVQCIAWSQISRMDGENYSKKAG